MARRRLMRSWRGAAAGCVVVGVSPMARAQADALDPSTLIDGLSREGMSELLLRLVEAEPSDDPVVDARLRIAQLQARYRDTRLEFDERRDAYREALDATRSLILEHNDHEQRPIWQTDLAEMLLVDGLRRFGREAELFVAYGVGTSEQRAAVADAAAEAFEQLSEAELRWFELEGELPRRADHVAKRVTTGLWDRMMTGYAAMRTPFYLAQAAVNLAEADEEHAYYAGLGRSGSAALREQAASPEAERDRLRAVALERVRRFVEDEADEAGVRDAASVTAARALVGLGEWADAARMAGGVAERAGETRAGMEGALAAAKASVGGGQAAEAVSALTRLSRQAVVRDRLLWRVVVRFAQHGAWGGGGVGPGAVAAAYRPYLELMSGVDDGAAADGLRAFIYERWADRLDAVGGLDEVPAVVRMGVGELLRQRGQSAAAAARTAGDAAAIREAEAELNRAIEVNASLVGGDDEARVRATAGFNLGLALVALSPGDPSGLKEATEALIAAGEAGPGTAVGERAAAIGAELARELIAPSDGGPAIAGGEALYRRAAGVLFEKYPTSEAADDERLSYAALLLVPAGAYEEAIDQLDRVPPGHASFFDAASERLVALTRVAQRMASGDPADASGWRRLAGAARRVADDVAAGDAFDDSVRRAGLEAEVALARVEAAGGDVDAGLALVAEMGGDEPVAMRLRRGEVRIELLLGAERFDEASDAAVGLLSEHGGAAAAAVDGVLSRVEGRVEELRVEAGAALAPSRRRQLEERASAMAGSAVALSGGLRRWAVEQGFDDERRVAFDLAYAKALRRAGRPMEAVEVLDGVPEAFFNDVAVIVETADALREAGGAEQLDEARELYDLLIGGLGEPFPAEWWNAWAGRLEIAEATGGGATVATRVRQLRFTDPELGGEPYKSRLEGLEARNR
ncbi:MAG: hypothetical protein AAF078_02055 [Planctomycetota bacterium]